MSEREEKEKATRMVLSLILLLIFLVGLTVWGVSTLLADFLPAALAGFEDGIGLKTAAIAAAVVSVLISIIFAIFSGDGFIGELQFMIPGFFLFFLFFWLMLAWVF
jgi:hypothetical protein